ncbi:helix-turn-helix domain-containing protein [Mucilaginibacter aquaedulcis]|uniref:helix-turn-helix domain-containing protein n=1 Tax=Mucilaginibacter aquaedulcis TaxID=1187081 RepID=UPI0025B3884E|nr:helix-turn-helix transcriptional regulator [Mucilaginibacter aquaedulcis]MDN3548933.1 helix-turn-helix transcriptional regulator [Mucilaginibacter aquaedulcis]
MKEKNKVLLKKLGTRIYKIRLEKGLSQDEVSYRCDVDRAKISKLETGNANCNVTTLVELAKGLNVDVRELLDLS